MILYIPFYYKLIIQTSESKTINEIPERPQFKIDVPANRFAKINYKQTE